MVTGEAKIAGYAAVMAVSDFAFMGGTMGYVVGEKVARSLEPQLGNRAKAAGPRRD